MNNFGNCCNYLFKASNKNTRTGHGICSRLTIETHEQDQWLVFSALDGNYEQILYHAFMFLLTLNRLTPEILFRNLGTAFCFLHLIQSRIYLFKMYNTNTII